MQILKEDIRAEILRCSMEQFLNNRYENSRMAEIASMAGISTSNLYHYYPSKESIFDRLTADAVLRIQALIDKHKDHMDSIHQEDFAEVIFHDIYELMTNERQPLLLLLNHISDVKYSSLYRQLVHMLQSKFLCLFENPLNNILITEIIAENFITGLMKILKDSTTDEKIYENLHVLINYHLAGMRILVPVQLSRGESA